MATTLMSKKYVILKSKARRGMSLFVLFFMFEVLLCGKHSTVSTAIPGCQTPADVIIGYIHRSGRRYRLTKDQAVEYTGLELFGGRVTRCLPNIVDILAYGGVGSMLTMAETDQRLGISRTVCAPFQKT
jgi:hypothetical protein